MILLFSDVNVFLCLFVPEVSSQQALLLTTLLLTTQAYETRNTKLVLLAWTFVQQQCIISDRAGTNCMVLLATRLNVERHRKRGNKK